MAKNEVIPCILCGGKFSEEDVKKGAYFVSTMVCKVCYEAMQNQPHSISCFGKLTVKQGRHTAYGYDSEAPECSGECPDRFICRVFVKQIRGVA